MKTGIELIMMKESDRLVKRVGHHSMMTSTQISK